MAAEKSEKSDEGWDRARPDVPEPPRGSALLRWWGPGLLWMISSVGSGTVLFTPRVGGRYGYALMWMIVGITFLMWVIITEVGRHTVVTGRTILDAFRDVPGPRNWAVWVIFVPEVVACVATVAGIAALLASVIVTVAPGSPAFYAVGLIVVACALVVAGRYKRVEQVSSVMAIVLTVAVIVAAVMVTPSPRDLLWGMQPGLPPETDYYFILPWIGFNLAGAAGILWFSYWVGARGFGGPLRGVDDERTPDSEQSDDERRTRLKAWVKVMATAAGIGAATGGIANIAFLILGAELLMPEGIVPEGVDVAEQLTVLLSGVWGQFGFWLIIVCMGIALWGTILSNEDGWSRMFADASVMLFGRRERSDGEQPRDRRWLPASVREGFGLVFQAANRGWVQRAYAIVLVSGVPIIIYLAARDPVDILSVGGIVTAAHIPVIVLIALYLNHTRLPKPLRPGRIFTTIAIVAVLFYGAFATLYLLGLVGVRVL